jgi:hypothetical protein
MMLPRNFALSGIVGAGCAVIFFFVFPGGAISTLMHEVLRLPGPGAGIALVLAPLLVFGGIFSYLATDRMGTATLSALAFGLTSVLLRSLGVPMYAPGGFGTLMFVPAMVLLGVILDGTFLATKRVTRSWRFALAGGLADLGLLVFYWVALFPQTIRWVQWGDVPLLSFLALMAGTFSGYIAGRGLRPLAGAMASQFKE